MFGLVTGDDHCEEAGYNNPATKVFFADGLYQFFNIVTNSFVWDVLNVICSIQ
jgi:hypothetical protein